MQYYCECGKKFVNGKEVDYDYFTEKPICPSCGKVLNEYKQIEIWIRGKLLCIITEDNNCIENFEQIAIKAGYEVITKEEDNKIIKMV